MTVYLAETVKWCRKDNAALIAEGQGGAFLPCCSLFVADPHVQTKLDARSCAESAAGHVISTGGVDDTSICAGAVYDSAGGSEQMCNELFTGARGVFVLCNVRQDPCQ